MINKLCCSRSALRPANSLKLMRQAGLAAALALWGGFLWPSPAVAGDAPAWLHAAATAPLPPHDEKTDAITLYSEDVTAVQSEGKIKIIERRAYKILRPGGRDYGVAYAEFDSNRKITGMKAWCIPAQGKDYEVKDREAVDVSLAGVESSELISDVRDRILRIPAADPGNVVGYEIEIESKPFILQDWWHFQGRNPVREARYTLQLPQGWEYKANWINHREIQPTRRHKSMAMVVTDLAGFVKRRHASVACRCGANDRVIFSTGGSERMIRKLTRWPTGNRSAAGRRDLT